MRKFSRNILFLFNLVAALALILAYAANHVNPASFWLLAFFGLAYPYFLLINIGFLLLWIWRRKKYLFLSLIVILAGVGNIGRYVQFRLPQALVSDSTQLKIMTYNVRVFDYYNWSGNNISRDSIAQFINLQEPDVICFQEYFTRTNSEVYSETYLASLLKQNPYSHISYTVKLLGSTKQFGIATYSKYPIIKRGRISFEKSQNNCIYSDLLVDEDTIRVYNLHLQSTSLNKDYTIVDSLAYINAKRIGEAKDISKRLKRAFIRRALQVDAVKAHIDRSPFKVIICGDFNDTPVSYSYQQLLGCRDDSFREAGSGLGRTYHGKLPSFRIDYVLHDTAFSAIAYSSPKVNLSDHYPVVSTLRIK